MPADAVAEQGRRELARRLLAVGDAARAAFAAPLCPPPFDPGVVRRFHATGLGSSAAHARLLAECLGEAGFEGGLSALEASFVAAVVAGTGDPANGGRTQKTLR